MRGAARSNRFSHQTAIPWPKSQPRGVSSSEGFALGMHETTPPSGVSTDLGSLPALLQPRPFAPRSAWLPAHPCTTPNPAHLKHAPSCSQHTDMPTWCGAGHGPARRKQSKSKSDPLCRVLSSALAVPPSTGAAQSCHPPSCLSVGHAPAPSYKPRLHVRARWWGTGLGDSFSLSCAGK